MQILLDNRSRLLATALALLLASAGTHGAAPTTRAASQPSTRPADQTPEVERAQAFFEELVALGDAFDSDLVDLYSDTAVIRDRRTYPDGTTRAIELKGRDYKPLLQAALPLAKARGDRSTYSDVTFTPEGVNVRIRAKRYSVLKDYTSPITWLVGPGTDDEWMILEQTSQSRP